MSQEFYFEARHKNGTKFSISSYSRSTMMYQIWNEVGVPSYSEARVITVGTITDARRVAEEKRRTLKEEIARVKDRIDELKEIARGVNPDSFEALWDTLVGYKDEVAELEAEIREVDGVIYELVSWSDMIEYENGEDWTFYGSIEGYLPGEEEELST